MTFFQSVLKHCLWIHGFDPHYARITCKNYEQKTEGLLPGLLAEFDYRVSQLIPKAKR